MHQHVVIDRVEKLGQIDIYGITVPFSDKINYLPDGLVR
jgi:hypothetical protein